MLPPSSLVTDCGGLDMYAICPYSLPHMARNKDFIRTLAQKLLQWKPTHRKRSRDRPSKSWLDCVKEDYHIASGSKSNVEDMTIAAEGRKEWRTLTRLRERDRRPLE